MVNIERQFEIELIKALLAVLLTQKLITTAEFQAMLSEYEKLS